MTLGLPPGLLPLLSWMGTYLVHSTLLIGGLWLVLRGQTPRSASLRATGWQLVLLAGLATSLAQVTLWPQAGWQFTVTTLASPNLEAAPLADTAIERPRMAGTGPTPLALTWAWGLVAVTVGSLVWGIARWARHWLAFRTLQAECVPVTEGRAWELLEMLRKRLDGAPEIDLVTTDEPCEPAAWALPRWTILLPERAERELDEATLQALLAHELAHLARHDSVWLAIARLLGACLAVQPLNHLARREWQRAAECLGDEWAVRQTGNPLALARCLATVAGWRMEPTVPQAALAALGTRSDLTERVERLLQSQIHQDASHAGRRAQMALAGMLLSGVAVAGLVPGFSLRPQARNANQNEAVALVESARSDANRARLAEARDFAWGEGPAGGIWAMPMTGAEPQAGAASVVSADFPRGAVSQPQVAVAFGSPMVCRVIERIWVGATRTVREQTVVVLSARGDVRWIQTTSAAWSVAPSLSDFPTVERRAL